MQKFIRIVLLCVCFAVIIWWCCFNGFQYIHWKWLILAAGIGAVCYIGLYVKLHKLQKQKEEHLCLLKKQAEEAVAPELEKVKGNWLKKEMIKRRMVKEYLEKNTDYYALTSSSCHPKFFVKEFSYFLMPCHQHGLGVNLLVQR